MRPRRYYYFIHGINTDSNDDADWDSRAARWIETRTDDRAAFYPYETGTLTRWLSQSRNIERAGEDLGVYTLLRSGEDLVLCGHSNGCAIACGILARDRGLRIEELHLIAPAVDPSFSRNGLNEAVARGQVGRIVLYCSKSDLALRCARWTRWLSRLNRRWGYGYLGLVGPSQMSAQAATRTSVLWHEGYGHGTYFDSDHFDRTMATVIAGGIRPQT